MSLRQIFHRIPEYELDSNNRIPRRSHLENNSPLLYGPDSSVPNRSSRAIQGTFAARSRRTEVNYTTTRSFFCVVLTLHSGTKLTGCMIFLVCLMVSYKIWMSDVSIDPHLEWTRKDFSMEELSLLEMKLDIFLLAVQNPSTAKASIVLSPQLASKAIESNQSQDYVERSNAATNSAPRHSTMSSPSPAAFDHFQSRPSCRYCQILDKESKTRHSQHS